MIAASLNFDRETYDKLLARYKDLFPKVRGTGSDDVPFDLLSHINEIETDKIDQDYMNARFTKWLKTLGKTENAVAFTELHHSFATLSQEDQRFAEQFLHDVQSGEVTPNPELSLSDYIVRYKQRAADSRIQKIIDDLGLNAELLHAMLARKYSPENLDLTKFKLLKESVNKEKAQAFFEETRAIYLNKQIDAFLRKVVTGEE